MKKIIFALALALATMPMTAYAAGPLDWAYPVAPPQNDGAETNGKMPTHPANQVYTAPGSPKKYTWDQINDNFAPPDWYPNEHPAMPKTVANGRKPHVRACIMCHLTSGHGHPESASVTGLPVPYVLDQLHYFRDGLRNNNRSKFMIEIAKDITDAEITEAAVYFSKIKPPKYVKVVEAKVAPPNFVGDGGALFYDKTSKTPSPISATQIFEISDSDRAELRDDHVGYTDYVPVGAVAKGRVVALGKHGAFKACSSCHGDDWKGHGNVPRLAGRGAYYLVRQLNDMRIGARHGAATGNVKDGNMDTVVNHLTDEDIVNVAAFMASREP